METEVELEHECPKCGHKYIDNHMVEIDYDDYRMDLD